MKYNMEKKLYNAPQITVVSFRTERGYAESGTIADIMNPEVMNDIALGLAEGQLAQDQQPMEEYQLRTGWYNPETESGSFF